MYLTGTTHLVRVNLSTTAGYIKLLNTNKETAGPFLSKRDTAVADKKRLIRLFTDGQHSSLNSYKPEVLSHF